MSSFHIKHLEEYWQVYRRSVRNPESFWEEIAEEHFLWRKRWDKVKVAGHVDEVLDAVRAL